MTSPNPAVGARPGWRGTDPDGGTWVRQPHGKPGRWAHFTAAGELVFRSQEEAEAAGLVPLYSFPEFESIGWVRAEVAAPAPLDPGNPEHLRQVAEFVLEAMGTAYQPVVIDMHSKAARLEAAAAEAEQDASDRKRATDFVDENGHEMYPTEREFAAEAFLAGLRAERARQEAGQ
ncbi:hypothetical protein [Tsukamurella sp. NPDC003166]|uniref:hypothetical protein n=1 Tax=Tsukamurella sp. NPDC003166 TaxID=3154444 RepID=UPI0033A92836